MRPGVAGSGWLTVAVGSHLGSRLSTRPDPCRVVEGLGAPPRPLPSQGRRIAAILQPLDTGAPSAICAAGIRDRLEPAIRPRLTSDRASTFSGYGPGRVAARAGILQEQVVAPGVVIAVSRRRCRRGRGPGPAAQVAGCHRPAAGMRPGGPGHVGDGTPAPLPRLPAAVLADASVARRTSQVIAHGCY